MKNLLLASLLTISSIAAIAQTNTQGDFERPIYSQSEIAKADFLAIAQESKLLDEKGYMKAQIIKKVVFVDALMNEKTITAPIKFSADHWMRLSEQTKVRVVKAIILALPVTK